MEAIPEVIGRTMKCLRTWMWWRVTTTSLAIYFHLVASNTNPVISSSSSRQRYYRRRPSPKQNCCPPPPPPQTPQNLFPLKMLQIASNTKKTFLFAYYMVHVSPRPTHKLRFLAMCLHVISYVTFSSWVYYKVNIGRIYPLELMFTKVAWNIINLDFS